MPAFTFEKLSTPTETKPTKQSAEKQPGTLGQLLNRLSEARVRRNVRRESLLDNARNKSPK
jgi:hypothetical protein